MIKTQIGTGKIKPFPREDSDEDVGAEIVFNGIVRGMENGKKIIALEYEHYEGMAERELQALAEETARKFAIHDLSCRHRVGKVPVGETSLHISIWSEHRAEGLEAMAWFITELKKRLPIWKWAILADGSRVASRWGKA